MIAGCSRWGAFIRVAIPSALPAIAAVAVLCWLFTWNEFLFALILTGNRVPVITVVMAQFVTEMGLHWNLMAATAVMALLPADRKSTRLNSSHVEISYAVFCLKKKKKKKIYIR